MKAGIFTIVLVAVLLQACSATHSGNDKRLSTNAKTVLKIIEGNNEIRQKWIDDSNRDKVIAKAIKGGDEISISNPGKYEAAVEKFIIDLVESKFHNPGQWMAQNNFIANKVWENNENIQLERSDLGKSNFRQVQGYGVIQYDLSGNGIFHEGQLQSIMRMRNGLGPIGPDGQPVLLCRILRSPNASFFEVTKTESIRFIKLASKSLSRDEICMNHSTASEEYWKIRGATLKK